jgi:hypothetical protein
MNSKMIDESLGGNEFIRLFDFGAIGAVSILLAKGALEYIGSRAMAQILGHPELRDMEGVIRNAIEELKNYIREELKKQIEENEIIKMAASLDSAVRNLNQYGSASNEEKPKLRFLLEDAFIKSGDAMSLASKFKINSIYIYMNAVSLRLLTLTCFYLLEHVESHKNAAITTVQEAESTVGAILEQHETSWDPEGRVSQQPEHEASRPEPEYGYQGYCIVWFYKDGCRREMNWISYPCPDWPDIWNFRATLLAEAKAEKANIMNVVKPPLLAIIQEWRKTSDALQKMAT